MVPSTHRPHSIHSMHQMLHMLQSPRTHSSSADVTPLFLSPHPFFFSNNFPDPLRLPNINLIDRRPISSRSIMTMLSYESGPSSSSSSEYTFGNSTPSTLTEYEVLYPSIPSNSKNADLIDLTPLSDGDEDGSVGFDGILSSTNSIASLSTAPTCFTKFPFMKETRGWKLKKKVPPLAEHLHFSCFSSRSKRHYHRLQECAKETYVGTSLNPFVGLALFAAQNIKAGEFIVLYEGYRMSYQECSARQKKGRPSTYALNVTQGVVIDALGFPHGAAMANHSCRPNARLRHGYLHGSEHAPYGYLQALVDINIGDEIECDYGHLLRFSQAEIDAAIRSGCFVPCRCLKPGCRIIFSMK